MWKVSTDAAADIYEPSDGMSSASNYRCTLLSQEQLDDYYRTVGLDYKVLTSVYEEKAKNCPCFEDLPSLYTLAT